jgi:hypothetical protein
MRIRQMTALATGAAVLLVPTAAHATATGTALTAAQLATEKAAVDTATRTAAADGWGATIVAKATGKPTITYTVNAGAHLEAAQISATIGGQPYQLIITAAGGSYEKAGTSLRKALTVAGYGAATYCHTADNRTPANLLRVLTTAPLGAPTARSADGPSVTYLHDNGDMATLTTVEGVALRSAQDVDTTQWDSTLTTPTSISTSTTFAYSPRQAITVPAAKNVISSTVCGLVTFRSAPRPGMLSTARSAVAANYYEVTPTLVSLRAHVRAAVKKETSAAAITTSNVANGVQLRVTSLPSKKVVTVTVIWSATTMLATIT